MEVLKECYVIGGSQKTDFVKILTKELSVRLRHVLLVAISGFQGDLLKGRWIVYIMSIANKVIFVYRSEDKEALIVKICYEKA